MKTTPCVASSTIKKDISNHSWGSSRSTLNAVGQIFIVKSCFEKQMVEVLFQNTKFELMSLDSCAYMKLGLAFENLIELN